MLNECQNGTQALMRLFLTAVDGERHAQLLYSEAIELCDDPDIRGTLEALLEAGRNHEQVLIQLYSKLRLTHDIDGHASAASEDRVGAP